MIKNAGKIFKWYDKKNEWCRFNKFQSMRLSYFTYLKQFQK